MTPNDLLAAAALAGAFGVLLLVTGFEAISLGGADNLFVPMWLFGVLSRAGFDKAYETVAGQTRAEEKSGGGWITRAAVGCGVSVKAAVGLCWSIPRKRAVLSDPVTFVLSSPRSPPQPSTTITSNTYTALTSAVAKVAKKVFAHKNFARVVMIQHSFLI